MIFATADQIARAIVAAARLTGADPLAVPLPSRPSVSGPIPRARYLAYVALREALPACNGPACGRGVGLTGQAPASNLSKIKRASWWREEWIDEIVGAILAEDEPAAIEVPAPPPARTPDDAALRRHWRPSPPPKRVKTPGLPLGEPPVGRSALDRRGLPQPDDEEAGARKKITLPRVKFLEKGL